MVYATYDCLSGSHCVVSVGHSSAVLIIMSYRNGAFFFHVLYSSLMIFSSVCSASFSCSGSTITQYQARPFWLGRVTYCPCLGRPFRAWKRINYE